MRKVAELQARGLVHFHVAVRLDGAEDRAMAPGVAVSPEELCAAIREAAGRVRLDGDAGHGETVELRFGEQLHTRVRAGADDGGELCAGKVAAYVAKYSCKSSHEQITSRDAKPDSWRKKGVPEHLIEMAGAALRLSELRAAPDRQVDAHAGLPRALRHQVARLLHDARRAARRPGRVSGWQNEPAAEPEDDSIPVLAAWEYVGSGYLNPGDVLLAAAVEASLRAGREALLDLRRGPPADEPPW